MLSASEQDVVVDAVRRLVERDGPQYLVKLSPGEACEVEWSLVFIPGSMSVETYLREQRESREARRQASAGRKPVAFGAGVEASDDGEGYGHAV